MIVIRTPSKYTGISTFRVLMTMFASIDLDFFFVSRYLLFVIIELYLLVFL